MSGFSGSARASETAASKRGVHALICFTPVLPWRINILGPLMEYNNMAEKASGGMVGLGALLGTGTQSRYASRGFIGSALGPTFGLLDTITDVTADVLNGDAGDRVLHNLRTLLPGNNLFWIAPLINQVDPGMK
jgi:hypothetical protein|nr:MAG TPA: hypothetical protein [Caudoviricetes sp.]